MNGAPDVWVELNVWVTRLVQDVGDPSLSLSRGTKIEG
jgi:hypothetical protein